MPKVVWTDEMRKAQGERLRLAREAKKQASAVENQERGAVAVETKEPESTELTLEERATRAMARRGKVKTLSPIEQIRPYNPNSIPDRSAGAYYIRPDGATIADALIWYPNGAKHDREYDPRGKYSENADYFQSRQKRKGFEYVGPVLTVTGAKRLVEVLSANRDAEVERLEDEIAIAEYSAVHSDRPEVRDQQRRRRSQLQTRLGRVKQPFDPEALANELQEIANAQEMANVPPQIMRVMRRMLEAQGQKINDSLMARFARKVGQGEEDPAMHQGVDSIA